jgi:glycosyltransferase involved in cell wall biosynthesis
MPQVWEQFPDTELHIIGDGDQAALLRKQAFGLEGPGRIRFHGFVHSPYSRLGDFDLFALASRSDNMPVAIMEAMLAGIPVVATAVGGVPEILRDSGCGILASEADAKGVSAAIRSALGLGEQGLRERGKRGEDYARVRFSVVETADRLFEVYRGARRSRAVPSNGPSS